MAAGSLEFFEDVIQYLQSSVVTKIDLDGILTEKSDSSQQELSNTWSQVIRLLDGSDHSNEKELDSLIKDLDFTRSKLKNEILQGDWKRGDKLNSRILYAFACLMKSMILIIQRHSCCLETALREIDDGLIMSPPIGRNILANVGQKLHDTLMRIKSVSCSEAGATTTSSFPGAEGREAGCTPIDFPAINQNVEQVSSLDLLAFDCQYLKKQHPVVISGAISHWKACQVWSVNYFRQIFGLRWVPIEIGLNYLDNSWTQEIIQFNDFADQYLSRKMTDSQRRIGYLAQYDLFHQVPLLRKDISLPDYCSLGDSADNVQINVWIGPAGTVSPLHKDPTDNLLTQIYGYKHIKLISSQVSEDIVYPHENCTEVSNTSRVDMQAVDKSLFARFHETEPFTFECILKPGQMLFIPKGWWHWVKSLSNSCSISFWW